MSAIAAFVWATAGSMIGAWILYWLGAVIGADRLRAIADRIWLVDSHDVDKALRWFDRYGDATILIGRVVPGIRSLISIPAGIDRMNLVKFSLLTLIGSSVWNAVLIWAGVLLGANYHRVADTIDSFSTVIYVLCAIAAVICVVYLVRRDRRRKAAGQAPGTSNPLS